MIITFIREYTGSPPKSGKIARVEIWTDTKPNRTYSTTHTIDEPIGEAIEYHLEQVEAYKTAKNGG